MDVRKDRTLIAYEKVDMAMAEYTWQDLEIVGMEGAAGARVSRAIAVAHVINKDIYFRLPVAQAPFTPEVLYTRAELNSLSSRKRITFFDAPIHVERDNILAGYIDADLLARLGDSIQEHGGLNWSRVHDTVLVTCAPKDALAPMMNQWARKLQELAEDLLCVTCFSPRRLRANTPTPETAVAEDFVEYALSACMNDRELRKRIYSTYAVALSLSARPERLNNLWEFVLAREFADWTREAFDEEWQRLRQQLECSVELERQEALYEHEPPVASRQSPQIAPRSIGDADAPSFLPPDEAQFLLQELMATIEKVHKIKDKTERRTTAFEQAMLFRKRYPVTVERVSNVFKDFLSASQYSLSASHPDSLKVLAGAPSMYCCEPIRCSPSHIKIEGLAWLKEAIAMSEDLSKRIHLRSTGIVARLPATASCYPGASPDAMIIFSFASTEETDISLTAVIGSELQSENLSGDDRLHQDNVLSNPHKPGSAFVHLGGYLVTTD